MQLGLSTKPCTLCPRQCGVDRTTERGYCGAPTEPAVASVTVHRGEEPPLVPIVNVFFAHCNLHCIYCQNRQISNPTSPFEGSWGVTVSVIADRIADLLPHPNGLLGFVTAAHYAHLLPPIMEELHARGLRPTVVYNSSGYESVATLRTLEGLVDIYLPDFKYMDADLAARYSHAPDYPEVATQALREMIRQVGTGLKVDPDGMAYRGLIVRHLVLPGHLDNTLAVLDHLDTFADFTPLHVSLMSQYYPPLPDLPTPIDRTLRADEYALAADRFSQLGFDGWLQAPDANTNYRPDFANPTTPFK